MRRKEKCPYKPPRPPRELCRTWVRWLLGIVSPSRLFMQGLSIDPPASVTEYFERCHEWELNVLRWKFQQGTATREERHKLLQIKLAEQKKRREGVANDMQDVWAQ